ncbi:MAG TPA: polysaccharide biosynthesis C-terminal domain-containing protein, partial [Negativicutes bacterium]
SIIKRIIHLAVPVSLTSIMIPVVANLDLLIVPYRLEVSGYSVEQATELFGYLTGMAVPLVNAATILTASLATSLVPAIAEAAALGKRQDVYQRAAMAMRISNLITVPGFVILWLLATPVSQLFYGTAEAGRPIAVLAVGIFLLGIHQVTTGVLQGLGRTAIPVINMAISAVVKVLLNWMLTAIPVLGIAGAAWATVADFGVAALLNLYFVKRYTGFTIDVEALIKIVVAGAAMAAALLAAYDLAIVPLGASVAVLVAVLVGGAVYVSILIGVGSVVERDIVRIPVVGVRLAAILQRHSLLKK